MPPRRSTTRRTASSGPHQSTLSFHGKSNKITKHTSGRETSDKAATKSNPALIDDLPSPPSAPTRTPAADKETLTPDPETTSSTQDAIPDPLSPTEPNATTADVLGGIAPESDSGATGGAADAGWVGDEAAQARAMPETRIKGYWRRKEQERLAPRVHQDELSVREKVLREWDMSGQYGPCIGIARLKRWKRANLLGLNPPMEVLAVLLKEMDEGGTASQRAYVDELMTSHSVEA